MTAHQIRAVIDRAYSFTISLNVMKMEFTHTINRRAESSAGSFDVIDPATRTAFARCPDASKEQLDQAVAAARRAFPDWAALSFEERRGYLLRFAQVMHERGAELIPLLVREQGKPLASATQELTHAPEQIERISSIEVK